MAGHWVKLQEYFSKTRALDSLAVPGFVKALPGAKRVPPRQPPPRCPVVTIQAQKVIHGMFQECDHVLGSSRCFKTIDDGKRPGGALI